MVNGKKVSVNRYGRFLVKEVWEMRGVNRAENFTAQVLFSSFNKQVVSSSVQSNAKMRRNYVVKYKNRTSNKTNSTKM